MSVPIANFASCLGKYDSTIMGAVVSDTSNNVGSGDISFNGGYVLNTSQFVLPAPINGNGISFSGWFYPIGTEPANTALFDLSCAAPMGTGNIAVYFLASNTLGMIYNGTSAITGINAYTPNTWNFFTYTVCCSGTTIAVQNLYINAIGTTAGLNPATLTNSAGTYTQFTVLNSYLGFGVGSYGATKFAGKMDDFRFYSRVISPMEYRVLYGYKYANTNTATLTPSLGTVSAVNGNTSSVPFIFSNTGTYSYLQYTRSAVNGTSVTGSISTALMTVNGQTYTWTDTTAIVGTTYLYTWTPCVLGTSGPSTTLTTTTYTVASPFTDFVISNILAGNTGFTMKWTGGVGTSVIYSCFINNVLTTPATGSLSNGTTGVTFTGLTAPTSSTTPTPYAWYIDICANNVGTIHGITTIYCPPTALVLSSTYNLGYISLGLVSGGLCNSNSKLTWSYVFTSGTGVTTSQTNLASFPSSPLGVLSTGSWTIAVTANNVCNGLTTGTATSSVSAFSTPFSGFMISNILTGNTGFTLNWIGGTGTSVTYSCYINNVLTTPTTGSLADGTTGVKFTGLTAPTSSTLPAPYAWYVDICANITGTIGTIHGITSFYCPPTPLAVTYSYTPNTITLALASGGLCNSSSSLTWGYQITGGTATTPSQTGLASFPTSLAVSGNGPWSVIVYANNVCIGTTVGSVNVSTFCSPFSGLIISNILSGNTGFTLNWTGGTSTTGTYSCYINNVLVTPASGSLSNGTTGVTFTGLTAPTSSTTPTQYAWYVDIWGVGIPGTTATIHGIATFWCPPTPLAVTYSYASNAITLALASGGLCNASSSLTWAYQFTGGTATVPSQTSLASFPSTALAVSGSGPWTIIVYANNISTSTSTSIGTVNVSTFCSPFSGFIISNILSGNTGFTLNWTGGTSTTGTYSCYINNVLVTPASGSLSNGTTGVTFTGLTAPTSSTTPTPYAWYVDIYGAGIPGTTATIHGIATFYCPPTPLAVTYSYASNAITLALASGGLCNASSSLTWAYQFTGGTATTMSQTGLASFPSSALTVSGNGPWTIIVYANNISAGTTVGTVNVSTFCSPFSGFIISNILSGNTGFTLNWTGGTGTTGTYSCYINNVLVTPASGSLSNGTTGVTFTGLTAPTSSTTPTPYAWYVDIYGAGIPGTTATIHGIATIYCPPTPFTMTSSYASNIISLTLASGGLCNASSSLTWGYQFTSGTSGTMSQTGLGSFPTSLGVTGSGPWSIIVTAKNISIGTIAAYVSSSVAAALPVAAAIPTAITGMSYGTQIANGFTVSWSGGSGATSYTYSVTYTATGVTTPFTGWTASSYTASPVAFTNMTKPVSGTYDVTVTAVNSSGSVSNTLTGCKVKPRYVFGFSNTSNGGAGYGGNNMIGYTTDGLTWVGVDNGTAFVNFGGVVAAASYGVYGSGMMMIAGQNGLIMTANNGMNSGDWTARTTLPNTNYVYGIAYGNSKWVAVGEGNNIIYYSANNGSTWTQCTVQSGVNINSNHISFGNGYFMVCGYNINGANGLAVYSTDGINFNSFGVNGYAQKWSEASPYKVVWAGGNTFIFLVNWNSGGMAGYSGIWFTNYNNLGITITGYYMTGGSTIAYRMPSDLTYDPVTDLIQFNSHGEGAVWQTVKPGDIVFPGTQYVSNYGWYTYHWYIAGPGGPGGNLSQATSIYSVSATKKYTVCATALLPGLYIAGGSVFNSNSQSTTVNSGRCTNPVSVGYMGGLNNYSTEITNYNSSTNNSYTIFPASVGGAYSSWAGGAKVDHMLLY